MSKIVDLNDTQPDLAALSRAISSGEEGEVLILDHGRPLARLLPVAATSLDEERERARDLLTGA